MLIYKAMYKMIDEGVHAEVLDFSGAISFGADMDEARRMPKQISSNRFMAASSRVGVLLKS